MRGRLQPHAREAATLRARGCNPNVLYVCQAMADQSLDNDEQLNVRWAYEDPNPRAQAAKLRNHAVQMLAAMAAKGHLNSIDETHDDACAAPW